MCRDAGLSAHASLPNRNCASSLELPATPSERRSRPWSTRECSNDARARAPTCSPLGGGSAIADYFAAANNRDLIELRQTLEVTAAGLAAQRRDEDDIEQLRALLVRRNELWAPRHVEPHNVEEAISTDIAVHRAVVAASHNALYLELYDSLLGLMDHYMRGNPIGAECSFEHEHTRLVESIIAGDIGVPHPPRSSFSPS